MAVFPRGVLSPWPITDEDFIGELDSGILRSGVSAPVLFLPAGEDANIMGDDEGTAASPLARLDARGVT